MSSEILDFLGWLDRNYMGDRLKKRFDFDRVIELYLEHNGKDLELTNPWECEYCGHLNDEEEEVCNKCDKNKNHCAMGYDPEFDEG